MSVRQPSIGTTGGGNGGGAAAGLKAIIKKVTHSNSSVKAMSSSTSSTSPHGVHHGNAASGMNVYKAMKEYVVKMATSIQGLKALVVDRETAPMIALVESLSALNTHSIFLTESIDTVAQAMRQEAQEEEQQVASGKLRRGKGVIMKGDVGVNEQKLSHLKCVMFIQPTRKNLDDLSLFLKSPRYKEYYLFFSNIVPPGYLEAIADADVNDYVKEVNEYFGDFYATTPHLYHFGASLGQATRFAQDGQSKQQWLYSRDLGGLVSILLSLKKRPDIRFTGHSALTKKLATDLARIIKQDEQQLFSSFHTVTPQGVSTEPVLLLILDRRDDPVTPLLTQWTYQAMVHELLNIENNRVELRKETEEEKKLNEKDRQQVAAEREVILSSETDQFFKGSMFNNFGELANKVKKLVSDFQELTKVSSQLDSIEDIARVIDKFPELKERSGTVRKHVNVINQCVQIVNSRNLYTVSRLEQELISTNLTMNSLVNSSSPEEKPFIDRLFAVFADPNILFEDKLRLILLFSLKFESNQQVMAQFMPQLFNTLRNFAPQNLLSPIVAEKAVEALLGYAGLKFRAMAGEKGAIQIFEKPDNILKNIMKSVASNIKGVENILTSHKPLLFDILTSLFNNELKYSAYPFADLPSTMANDNTRNGGAGMNPNSNNTINNSNNTISMRESPLKYRKVIVFIAGGVTYEEYCSVEMNFNSPQSKYKGDFHVLLGGSFIHNSHTFLQTFFNKDEYIIQQSNNVFANLYGSSVVDASSQPPQMYQTPSGPPPQGYGPPPPGPGQPPAGMPRGRPMNNQGYQRV